MSVNAPTREITVRYFAWLREKTGISEILILIAANASSHQVLDGDIEIGCIGQQAIVRDQREDSTGFVYEDVLSRA